MKAKAIRKELTDREYYDTHGGLENIIDEDIDLSLEDALAEEMITG